MLQEVNNFPGIMFFSIYTKRKKKKTYLQNIYLQPRRPFISVSGRHINEIPMEGGRESKSVHGSLREDMQGGEFGV